MSPTGWVSLHRQTLEWEWYTDANASRLFFHCLLKANHMEKKWRGITIKRGQFLSSFDTIATELGLSRQKVRTAAKKLNSTNDLTNASSSQHTVFTVVHYDKYQTATNDSTIEQPTINQRITNEQPTANQPITTTNNVNNENKVNNVNNKTKRFVKPTVPDIKNYMVEREVIDPDQQANSFFDYHESKGWKVGNAAMKDWKSAVRTWITNSKKFNQPKSNGFHAGDHFDLSNDQTGYL